MLISEVKMGVNVGVMRMREVGVAVNLMEMSNDVLYVSFSKERVSNHYVGTTSQDLKFKPCSNREQTFA